MGNNNSTNKNVIKKSNSESIFEAANDMYQDVLNDNLAIYTPDGKKMIYSNTSYDMNPVSENPRYVEIEVANGKEKYAIHNGDPCHQCCANCHCIPQSETNEKEQCMMGGGDSDSSSSNDDNNDDYSDTSSDVFTEDMIDIADESEEDDEVMDLNPFDEDTDSVGGNALLEQSDITSSDLYRMQRRIFESETETDYDTENVEDAIRRLEGRQPYDSEDRIIMGMEYTEDGNTEDYMHRPIHKNNKYN